MAAAAATPPHRSRCRRSLLGSVGILPLLLLLPLLVIAKKSKAGRRWVGKGGANGLVDDRLSWEFLSLALGLLAFSRLWDVKMKRKKGAFNFVRSLIPLYIWMNSSNHELLHDACLTKSCSPGHNERGDARDKRFCCFRLIYAHV